MNATHNMDNCFSRCYLNLLLTPAPPQKLIPTQPPNTSSNTSGTTTSHRTLGKHNVLRWLQPCGSVKICDSNLCALPISISVLSAAQGLGYPLIFPGWYLSPVFICQLILLTHHSPR